ncbi:hypothetical protein SAMN04487820_10311 [Actinopolyspora mzabensis]|uniref:Uncharacterized protein n=1 Tax=Actinopolyspora mzabensis TaxID=995066 RepID=A0A1G8XQE5_ACTMZ|nr:hypothetical protein [Actinopolyspora mzabensis]SDJ92789.1 hypothetical protein SAMN04487820_10311 [Actinopolyspora mzabensis]
MIEYYEIRRRTKSPRVFDVLNVLPDKGDFLRLGVNQCRDDYTD